MVVILQPDSAGRLAGVHLAGESLLGAAAVHAQHRPANKIFFINTEKFGFDISICSVRFWIPDSYGDSHVDQNMILQFYDCGIFLFFGKIRSNFTKVINSTQKKLYKAVLWSQSQEARSRN